MSYIALQTSLARKCHFRFLPYMNMNIHIHEHMYTYTQTNTPKIDEGCDTYMNFGIHVMMFDTYVLYACIQSVLYASIHSVLYACIYSVMLAGALSHRIKI
jgi:hypothetical protein